MKIITCTILIFICFIISCKTNLKPTNNNGGYTISVLKNNSLHNNDSIVIYGYIKEIDQNEPLKGAIIKAGCYSVNVDNDGFYKIRERTEVRMYITGMWIGYKSVESEFFKSQRGDSIKIDFFLTPDDRPLINCEGVKK